MIGIMLRRISFCLWCVGLWAVIQIDGGNSKHNCRLAPPASSTWSCRAVSVSTRARSSTISSCSTMRTRFSWMWVLAAIQILPSSLDKWGERRQRYDVDYTSWQSQGILCNFSNFRLILCRIHRQVHHNGHATSCAVLPPPEDGAQEDDVSDEDESDSDTDDASSCDYTQEKFVWSNILDFRWIT